MGPFELLEKLINEHGSASILREHIGLLKAQHAALELKCNDLQAQNAQLKGAAQQHQTRADAAEQQLKSLRSGALHVNVCAHCGGPGLDRIGTRNHAIFGELGLKEALFRCRKCSTVTAIEIPLG